MCKGFTPKHLAAYLFLFFILNETATPHGGVFVEDDLCVIQIDFFKAHFTVYQPQKNANKEFCEDLPNAAESLFVLDYLHDSLKSMPVDFRIIKNPTNLGRATKWEDIIKLKSIDQHTVYYQPALVAQDGTLTSEYSFSETGNYVGIITTQQQGNEKIYRAVFPFKVGTSNIGYLPLFLMLILLVEIYYLYSNGSLKRWLNKFSNRS